MLIGKSRLAPSSPERRDRNRVGVEGLRCRCSVDQVAWPVELGDLLALEHGPPLRGGVVELLRPTNRRGRAGIALEATV